MEKENKENTVKVIKVKLSTLVIVLVIFTITIMSLIFLAAEYSNLKNQRINELNNSGKQIELKNKQEVKRK